MKKNNFQHNISWRKILICFLFFYFLCDWSVLLLLFHIFFTFFLFFFFFSKYFMYLFLSLICVLNFYFSIFLSLSIYVFAEQDWDIQKQEFISQLKGEITNRRALSPTVILFFKYFWTIYMLSYLIEIFIAEMKIFLFVRCNNYKFG